MKKITTIKIGKTAGKDSIANAKNVFPYIDSDFKNWELDKKEKATKPLNLDVHELTENSTFAQMFTDPENMCLTQNQIINFVENNKEHLSKARTFFLFKVGDEFFVADVRWRDDGRLWVYVFRFSRGGVWRAGGRLRIVVPATDSVEISPLETSSSSDSLTLRVEKLEKWGMSIGYKK